MSVASPKFLWRVIRRAFTAFLDHDVLTLAAALAFYTLLSFAPIMMLLFWATAALDEHTQQALVSNLTLLGGSNTQLAAQTILGSLRQSADWTGMAGAAGLVIVLVGATLVFAQLQTTLDRIWDIEAPRANAIWLWLRQRIISMGVLLAAAFVLIVSTAVSAALDMLLARTDALLGVVNDGATVLIFTCLFAALFRYLPDARLSWRRAFAGGGVAAVLFGIGKALIGAYLAHGHVGRAYGAAGSIVVLLVWTYYSSAIFFFSAELLQAWLNEHGVSIAPLRPRIEYRSP